MTKFEPEIHTKIWPEVIEIINHRAQHLELPKAAIARMAVARFRLDTYSRNENGEFFPSLEEIEPLYDESVDFRGRYIYDLPTFIFSPDKGTTAMLRRAPSLSEGARRILAFEMPQLETS